MRRYKFRYLNGRPRKTATLGIDDFLGIHPKYEVRNRRRCDSFREKRCVFEISIEPRNGRSQPMPHLRHPLDGTAQTLDLVESDVA